MTLSLTTSLQIATWDRSPQLALTLERLTELTIPDEILIIDDGSDDGCREVCKRFRLRLPLVYIYNHRPFLANSCQARNVGIRNTNCDLIITSGPEILFVTDVVDQLRRFYRYTPYRTVSVGKVFFASCPGVTDHLSCELRSGLGSWYTTICPRKWLLDVGGWDEALPGCYGFDDCDLHRRLNIYRGYPPDQVLIDFPRDEAEVVHQWHRPSFELPGAGEGMRLNAAYHDARLSDLDPVANRGREWGRQIPR